MPGPQHRGSTFLASALMSVLALAGAAAAGGDHDASDMMDGASGAGGTTSSATAIGSGVNEGLATYTNTTLALSVTVILVAAFSVQVARGYFLRTLEKFTLRLGADIWWLSYVMIRDGLLLAALLLGFQLFYVGTYGHTHVAVPFMPAAILLVALVLLIKLVRDADEEERTDKVVTVLLAVATTFYIFGVVFVTEDISHIHGSGYMADDSGRIVRSDGRADGWTILHNAFSSSANLALVQQTLFASYAALGLMGSYALFHVLRPRRREAARRPPDARPPATRPAAVAAAPPDRPQGGSA